MQLRRVVAVMKKVTVTGTKDEENASLLFKTPALAKEWAKEITICITEHRDDDSVETTEDTEPSADDPWNAHVAKHSPKAGKKASGKSPAWEEDTTTTDTSDTEDSDHHRHHRQKGRGRGTGRGRGATSGRGRGTGRGRANGGGIGNANAGGVGDGDTSADATVDDKRIAAAAFQLGVNPAMLQMALSQNLSVNTAAVRGKSRSPRLKASSPRLKALASRIIKNKESAEPASNANSPSAKAKSAAEDEADKARELKDILGEAKTAHLDAASAADDAAEAELLAALDAALLASAEASLARLNVKRASRLAVDAEEKAQSAQDLATFATVRLGGWGVPGATKVMPVAPQLSATTSSSSLEQIAKVMPGKKGSTWGRRSPTSSPTPSGRSLTAKGGSLWGSAIKSAQMHNRKMGSPSSSPRNAKRSFGAAMRAALKSGKLAAAVETGPDETSDPTSPRIEAVPDSPQTNTGEEEVQSPTAEATRSPEQTMRDIWDDTAADAEMDPLPVASIIAALQLDCPIDLPLRARRMFDAIESACTSDAPGYASIGRSEFCDAVVGTLPYPDPIPVGQPARTFLVRYFGVLYNAYISENGAMDTERLPFSEACLGLAMLLLCPTRASTAQTMEDVVVEIFRILTAHVWSIDGPRDASRGLRGVVLESELTHLLWCVLNAEAMMLGIITSMISTTVPIDMLASAMCNEMMQGGHNGELPFSSFRRWMLQMPHKLHPELVSFLEDNHDSDVERGGRAEVDYRSRMSASGARGSGAGTWWDYTAPNGRQYFSRGDGGAVWDMPQNVWVGTVDEASGTPYWYHTATMERSWEDPLTVHSPY